MRRTGTYCAVLGATTHGGRKCQAAAVKQGHKDANCRPAPQPSPQMTEEELVERFEALVDEAETARMTGARVGHLAALEKLKEATEVAHNIGGADGAFCRAQADKLRSNSLLQMVDMGGAARAACSMLRAARASGSRTMLVEGLTACGAVAQTASDEMASAERESRYQERLGGSPQSFGGRPYAGGSDPPADYPG